MAGRTNKIRLLSQTASLTNGSFQSMYPTVSGNRDEKERGEKREGEFQRISISELFSGTFDIVPVCEMGYCNEWYSVYFRDLSYVVTRRCSAARGGCI